MSVDPALVLVYLPTTSSSSDFFGGGRVGDNRYTSSLVALRGKTGEVVWNFQFVHHNVFDYDTPSAPLLVDYPVAGGGTVPALVQNNKNGLLFVQIGRASCRAKVCRYVSISLVAVSLKQNPTQLTKLTQQH